MIGVEAVGISKSFGPARVLDRIDLAFAAGGFTSLLGPSGSGKTTLLRIIGGFVTPDQGDIRFGTEIVTRQPVWLRHIGMVFQSYALFPHMTVRQNVAFGLHRRGVRAIEAGRAVAEVLDMVHLTGLETRRPKELSGGQQQRVALARAIVTKPRVLLLDEPLSALDRRLRQEMQVELRRIQRDSGLTTIFVTHDQEEALALSDTVAILDRGRIVQTGAPAEIYERPRTRFAASFLGDANFFTGAVRGDGVQTACGLVRTTDALAGCGGPATLAVRPEKMRLAAAGPAAGSDNHLLATITDIVYAGPQSTFIMRSADGQELRVLAQNADAATLEPGSPVSVTWHARDAVLMQPDPPAA